MKVAEGWVAVSAPEATEVDFALILYNAAVRGGSWVKVGRSRGVDVWGNGHPPLIQARRCNGSE